MPANPSHKSRYRAFALDLLVLLVGALLICGPALYSGFPLIYQDSGSYLAAGFEGLIPLGRPATYGWLIRLASPGEWLWGVIFLQGLLLSYAVRRTLKVLFPGSYRHGFFLICTAILVLFSGLGWYTAQLMPDIFSALLILVVFLLLFDDQAGLFRRTGYFLLAYLSAVVHYSHASMTMALLLVLGIWMAWQMRKGNMPGRYLKRMWWPIAATLLTVATFFTINMTTGHGMKMTRASHVFLMGRMVACGLLGDYLNETCAEKEWSLCPYKNDLPISATAFIWNKDSPFKMTGYWKNSETEYNAILKDMLLRPKYFLMFAGEGIEAGLEQLVHVRVGDGVARYQANSSPWKFFARRMPQALSKYQASRQAAGIDFRWLNATQFVLLGASALWLYWCIGWFRRRFTPVFFYFLITLGGGYIINAFVTAALGNTYDRLQGRVAWLVILAAMAAVYGYWQASKTLPDQSGEPGDKSSLDGSKPF